jgi:type VI secretion system VgrG family protein
MGNFLRIRFVAVLCLAAAGISRAQAAGRPAILRAIPDPAGGVLFIHGENFGVDPTAFLDGLELALSFASDSLIQAEIPPDLEPGTYLLIVWRSHRANWPPRIDDLAVMDLTLGAVGPEGPPGERGPAGERGPEGQIGPPGRDGATWLGGDGAPPADLGRQGDLYLDRTTGDVYRRDALWSLVLNLKGPEGPKGPPGPRSSDEREKIAALLGVEGGAIHVPPEGIVPARCGAGASVSFSLGTVVGLFGEEAISAPFRFHVAVRGASNPASLLGQAAQLTIGNLSSSTFQGIVTGAAAAGTFEGDPISVVTLEPALARAGWFRGFRAFQVQGASDIAELILADHGISARFSLLGNELTLDYEVQWNESDLDFVSRLLEREGIHYHVSEDGSIVFGDHNAVFESGPALPYLGHFADPGEAEIVTSFRAGGSVSPQNATVRGWDFFRKQVVVGSAASPGGIGDVVTFLPDAEEGEIALHRARTHLAVERAQSFSRTGTSNAPAVRAGRRVSVSGAGGAFSGDYVVVGVQHVIVPGEGCFGYGNRFSAIPASVPYRPPRTTPVPTVAGTITAIVTNNNDPDRLYRVKVKFPWGEFESDWARVAVPYRGGVFFLPEVDDEVLVAFEGGDPRRPYVVGSLYNGRDRPPAPSSDGK